MIKIMKNMESQSISKNLFFMVFSFSKKEITRKLSGSNSGWIPPSMDLFFENQGFVLKIPIKFAIVEHI